jgi:SAM-dependent methyltransferase
MCNSWCIKYWSERISKEQVEGKKVIEVGSLDVNGSLRSIIEMLNPSEYVGVDITEGRGVDIICDAEDIIEHFGRERFDFVVSTELIEHVKNWQKVVSNIKNICMPEGTIIVTTRSYGFPYHGYPYDFWRYEIADMAKIFADCTIEILEPDESEPGVFMRAKKPKGFLERDLSSYELYSIKPPANKQQKLAFILTQGPNKVTITEELVIEMSNKIEEARRMGKQQQIIQGPNKVTIAEELIIEMSNKIEEVRRKREKENEGNKSIGQKTT